MQQSEVKFAALQVAEKLIFLVLLASFFLVL